MRKIYAVFVDDGSILNIAPLNHRSPWENENCFFVSKSMAETQVERIRTQSTGCDFFIEEFNLNESE
jgi:hypothetical protein